MRACALRIPELLATQPNRSLIKSIDRFKIFCLLWRSSDCFANENECNDSDGKRWRSSRAGKEDPEGKYAEALLEEAPECADGVRGRGMDEVERLGSVKTRVRGA